MLAPNEQVAIIKDANYGMRDAGEPVLWFTATIPESCGSLQAFWQPRANEIIEEADIYKVADLNGRACIVEVSNSSMIFKRMVKL